MSSDERATLFERQLEGMPTASSTTNFSKASGLKHYRMEVDLLGAEAHIAIELDGAQHLENAEAYRRDRSKDVLLQENGYHVLRFLREDVCERLDEVLDAIIRALSHRRTQQPTEKRRS